MGKCFRIKGKVCFQNLATGFWGIIGEDGRHWRPINLASDMEKDNLAVDLFVEECKGQVSIFMWGTAVRIIETRE